MNKHGIGGTDGGGAISNINCCIIVILKHSLNTHLNIYHLLIPVSAPNEYTQINEGI